MKLQWTPAQHQGFYRDFSQIHSSIADRRVERGFMSFWEVSEDRGTVQLKPRKGSSSLGDSEVVFNLSQGHWWMIRLEGRRFWRFGSGLEDRCPGYRV